MPNAGDIAAIAAVIGAVGAAIAAVVTSVKKRDDDYEGRLQKQVLSLRKIVNLLKRALGVANRKLIAAGLDPVDEPIEEEYVA